jgi:hypothetical protein
VQIVYVGGREHVTQGPDSVRETFEAVGLADHLVPLPPGQPVTVG